MGETTRARAARIASQRHQCGWCLEWKTKPHMRDPDKDRGKTPPTCYACRVAHPDQAWCAHHDGPHPIAEFQPYGGQRKGVHNICRAAHAQSVAQRRQCPGQTCAACGVRQDSWQFRGGRAKSPVCRTCESENPGLRLCVECGWRPQSAFQRGGKDGQCMSRRCDPCRAAYNHGTTVAEVLRRQGSSVAECASCGDRSARLAIDHDHSCCPGSHSCGRCVRAYLCRACNTSEGLLGTIERARALVAYMERCRIAPTG